MTRAVLVFIVFILVGFIVWSIIDMRPSYQQETFHFCALFVEIAALGCMIYYEVRKKNNDKK